MMECRLTIVNSLGQPVATLDSEVSAPGDVRDRELGPRIECEVAALPLLPGPLPDRRPAQRQAARSRTGCRRRPSSTSSPASSATGRSPTAGRRGRRPAAHAGGCRRERAVPLEAPRACSRRRRRASVEPLAAPPTFSIVIPAYQAAETIGDAVGRRSTQAHPGARGDRRRRRLDATTSTGALAPVRRRRSSWSARRTAAAPRPATPAPNAATRRVHGDPRRRRRLPPAPARGARRRSPRRARTSTWSPPTPASSSAGEAVGQLPRRQPFAAEDQRTAIFESCFVGGWPAVRLEPAARDRRLRRELADRPTTGTAGCG